MKIVLVGPGIMEIPPRGWGAVEILIWDYKEALEKKGHEVFIVNTQNREEIIKQVNNYNPDFVHIQYDDFWMVSESFKCKNVAITSHFGYLEQKSKYGDYSSIFNGFLSLKNTKLFCLSEGVANMYREYGANKDRLYITPNGVRDDLFAYEPQAERPELSIYLAKVDFRKRQYLFHDIPNLYFAGRIVDSRFKNNDNYLGELNKEYLYKKLTKFGNLVLLSDGEAHPLVCLEAMVAGLGLVLSEYACANLDLSKPFITVIPETKINDIEYVHHKIEENKLIAATMRNEIRNYAIESFSYNTIIKNYIKFAQE